ncbi:N-acetyltransferase [uncultured Metabacillus sp.]|uniref:GNAT family N-acetyltransferase n=1 Tax=uncultured Metabacillus sp. TaxID=2860135 RepID=UPI00262E8C73|nr:GNAT family N-acetyltransferase [uncultured Metabacillus sp.]
MSELEEFSSILKEAAEWLINNEREMWDPNQFTIEKLLKNNVIDEMFIGFINNESAVAMILQEEDPIFWSDPTPSLYLHKLAIRRKYAQKGLSQQMISWAKLRAKQHNKNYLRLDCAADRPKLCNFYEKQGFIKVRDEVMFGKYPTSFYEIEII